MIKENKIFNVIKGQYSTEKTNRLAENQNAITFKVLKDANKYTIKNAVEKIFNVKVLSVNTLNKKGKNVKFKNFPGKKKDFKKAIVTLKKGYDINFADFE